LAISINPQRHRAGPFSIAEARYPKRLRGPGEPYWLGLSHAFQYFNFSCIASIFGDYLDLVPDLNPCPANPEEIAEAYLLRSLPLDEANEFAEHYFACSSCAAVVERIQCILAIERTAERLRASQTSRAKRTGT
jgi:hypothetical protein